MKAIVLYYSYGGNTRKIAAKIQKALTCDAAEIKPQTPYVGNYNAVVEQGQREINSGYMPKLQPLDMDLSRYDTIILGTPVWWYTFAPAMKTFLHNTDFNGKEVYLFATNGGWLGHTFQDFKKALKGASVHTGLNIRFNEDLQLTSDEDIASWLRTLQTSLQTVS